MALDESKLLRTVEALTRLLANRCFGELALLTDSIRMRSEEIEQSVDAYPGKVISEVSLDDLDVVQINTSREECWSVNVRLHTDQEGPSDLTMSLTLVQSEGDRYVAEIDDIHVL
jgi:hypothetical protein